jgi:nucleoside-diphosphate-sugar epimerase
MCPAQRSAFSTSARARSGDSARCSPRPSGSKGSRSSFPRAGDLPRNSIDPTEAEMGLGWKPWTPLAEGLRQIVLWFAGEI